MKTNFLVIGGSGQAGSIHLKNLIDLDHDVINYDFIPNNLAIHNYSPAESTPKSIITSHQVTHVLIALPDHLLFLKTKELLTSIKTLANNSIQSILIEKPGSLKANDLQQLVDLSQNLNISFFINYQRSFNLEIKNSLKKIEKLVQQDGYNLDFISIYSCDKDVSPQSSPQVINQGCHDIAILLNYFDAAGLEVDLKSVNCDCVQWEGTEDTKFVRMDGKAEQTLFEVRMSRVSSYGTYTNIELLLTKKNEDIDSYDPIDIRLKLPTIFDKSASWADTWKSAFVQSAKHFAVTGSSKSTKNSTNEEDEIHVNAQFGVRVLKFAEKALEKLNESHK